MKRLLFWKRNFGKDKDSDRGPLKDSLNEAKNEQEKEDSKNEETCSEPAPDVDDDPETSKWRRESSLSFETFKGPQSSSSSASSSPESSRGADPKSSQPTFDVLYSEVNKAKQVPVDSPNSAHPEPAPESQLVGDNEASTLSFDDVLESFRLSLNDLEAITGDSNKPPPTETKPSEDRSNLPGEGDRVSSDGSLVVNDKPDMDNYGLDFDPASYSFDVNSYDADLMMSDEIVIRPRKKSVTFSEHIQERPLSTGESDTGTSVPETEVKAPIPNGVNKQNGFVAEPTSLQQPEVTTDDVDAETTKINGKSEQEVVRNGVREVPVDDDDELSVTAEDLDSEEEELLKKQPIKVRRLVMTRTVVVVIVWMSLGLMCDTSTLTFPTIQSSLAVTMETLARAHITRGAGALLAVIITTVFCCWTTSDEFVWVIFGLVVMTTSLLWLPWCGGLQTVLPAFAGSGFGEFMCLAASVVLVSRIWSDRKRDVTIHLLFAFKALASAIVPQTTRYLVNAVGNWSIPGISFRPLPMNETGNDHHEHQLPNQTVDFAFVRIVPMYIPDLFPVFLITSSLAVVCILLLCGVLTYKQCQSSKRKEMQRNVRRIQKKLFKKQIRLIRPKDQSVEKNGLIMTNGGSLPRKGDVEAVLTRVEDLRNSQHSATEEQITKLLEYAKYIQSQTSDKPSMTPQKERKSVKNTWLIGNQTFGVPSQLYLYVFFTLGGGLTVTYSQFLYIYANQYLVDTIGYEDDLVFTLFWGSVAVSRFIVIPISRILSPNAIMITCLVTNMSASAIMLAHAARYPVLLWLFGGLIGASIGPILPGGFTWANIYYNMRATKSVGLLFGFWCLGVMLFPWCSGFVVHNWGLPALFYMTITTTGLAFLLYIPILITFSKRRHFDFGSKRSSEASLPTRTYL